MNINKKRFAISLSFSGGKRDFVSKVANSLTESLGEARVLYDRFHEVELSTLNLDTLLPNLYKNESELIVVFLSGDYKDKRWCGLEWRAIRQLIKTDREGIIMPISFGDHGDLSDIGIYAGDGYLDVRDRAPETIAKLILEKHHKTSGNEKNISSTDTTVRSIPKNPGFIGERRRSILEFFINDWLPSNSAVAMIQGFSGAGKTQLASDITEATSLISCFDEANLNTANPSHEILATLSAKLASEGIDLLEKELKEGNDENLIPALENALARNDTLIVIDEFQALINPKQPEISSQWKQLIQSLCKSRNCKGKLLLISNRNFERALWNESCIIKNLDGLEDHESASLLTKLLEERNLTDEIPKELRPKIGRRLGGNPRALKTLAGSLSYSGLDEIMSFAPDASEAGDLRVSPELLNKFEVELIQRSLSASKEQLRPFLERISIYRKAFPMDVFEKDEIPLRNDLIDRFLLEFARGKYVVHPIAREIGIHKLQQKPQKWKKAQSLASDFYFRYFRKERMQIGDELTSAYIELRYHLHEADRMSELSKANCKIADYAISSITLQRLTMPPNDTLILEERIALLSALSDKTRPKRLNYHLALCLKTRDVNDDCRNALKYARMAVSPKAYYAYWLLLIELEYKLNGVDGLTNAYQKAVANLSEKSNFSEICMLTSELYDKENCTEKSIEILKEASEKPIPSGKDAIIRKCAEHLEGLGRRNEAIDLLFKGIKRSNVDHRGVLSRYCAELLERSGKRDEAITVLKHAIKTPSMSYLVHIYLQLANYYEAMSLPNEAEKWLQEGISDSRVKHKDKLHRRSATLLAEQSHEDEALAELTLKIQRVEPRKSVALYHSYANIAEKSGKSRDAIKLLKAAYKKRELRRESSLYLCCANLYFRERDLRGAISVLREGLKIKNLKNKSDVYIKLADLLHRNKQTPEAINLLDEAEKDTAISNRFQLFKKHSELLEKTGRIDDAIILNKEAIDSPALKNKAVIYQSYAKLLEKYRGIEESEDVFEEALNTPNLSAKVIIYHSYATLLRKAGRAPEAVELLAGAISGAKMGNTNALYKLCAELAHDIGKTPYAIEVLRKGIELYPKDESLKRVLKEIE